MVERSRVVLQYLSQEGKQIFLCRQPVSLAISENLGGPLQALFDSGSTVTLITEEQAERWKLHKIDSPNTMEVTGALDEDGRQTSRAKYVIPLKATENSVDKDSIHYVTAWAAKKIQHATETTAPWQLRMVSLVTS